MCLINNTCSPNSSLWSRRTYQRLCRRCGRRIARKSFPSSLLVSRYEAPLAFSPGLPTDLGNAKITDNDAALRQIMRLRGFSLMTNILQDHAKDIEVTILVRFPSSWAFRLLILGSFLEGPRSHGQVASHSAEQGRRLQDPGSSASLRSIGERVHEIAGTQGLSITSGKELCTLTSVTQAPGILGFPRGGVPYTKTPQGSM